MSRNKIYIGTAIVLGAISTTLIINGLFKKKLYNAVLKKITKIDGGYGDFRDVKKYFSTQWIIKVKNTLSLKGKDYLKLKDSYITKYRKDLYDAIDGGGTDENAIISVFEKIPDGVAIAYISNSYLKNYNRPLFDDIVDEFDGSDDEDLMKIYRIIARKKGYRIVRK